MHTSHPLRVCLVFLTLVTSSCTFFPALSEDDPAKFEYTGWGYAGIGELIHLDVPNDADKQEIIGIALEAREPESDWSSILGLQYARDAENAELLFYELNLSARHYTNPWGALAPYLGGGFQYGVLDVDTPAGESEEAFGAFLNAGLVMPLGDALSLGLEYRYLFTKYEDSTSEFDADSQQLTIGVGLSF